MDGAIYGIPAHAETVLKVVPATGEVRTIGAALELYLFSEGFPIGPCILNMVYQWYVLRSRLGADTKGL